MEKEPKIKDRNKAGENNVKGHGKIKDGKLLVPYQKDGKTTMMNFDEVKEIIETKVKERKVKNGKHKFIPNGRTVDAIPVETKKEKRQPEVFVADFKKEFKDLTTDVDSNGFVNFRIGKNIQFYAIDRKQGFVALSTRDAHAKSGWRTDRIATKEDFDDAVKTLKLQIENKQKFATAFIPWYHCPECDYTTQSKDEMTNHLATHGAD